MYKAINPDTDKILDAIKNIREHERNQTYIRIEKEKAHLDGFNDALDAIEKLFECSNYEKPEEPTYTDGICDMIYQLGREFDILTQDIRDNLKSQNTQTNIGTIEEVCISLTERIKNRKSDIN